MYRITATLKTGGKGRSGGEDGGGEVHDGCCDSILVRQPRLDVLICKRRKKKQDVAATSWCL